MPTHPHIHAALAHEREADLRRAVRPLPRPPHTHWTEVAPVVSLVAGIVGLAAVAAPSL
jgi:hypothetical protein